MPSHECCGPTLISEVDRDQAAALLRLCVMERSERLAGKWRSRESISGRSQPPPLRVFIRRIDDIGVTKVNPDPRLWAAVAPTSLYGNCVGKAVEQRMPLAQQSVGDWTGLHSNTLSDRPDETSARPRLLLSPLWSVC
jgi:hypothetical protein